LKGRQAEGKGNSLLHFLFHEKKSRVFCGSLRQKKPEFLEGGGEWERVCPALRRARKKEMGRAFAAL